MKYVLSPIGDWHFDCLLKPCTAGTTHDCLSMVQIVEQCSSNGLLQQLLMRDTLKVCASHPRCRCSRVPLPLTAFLVTHTHMCKFRLELFVPCTAA